MYVAVESQANSEFVALTSWPLEQVGDECGIRQRASAILRTYVHNCKTGDKTLEESNLRHEHFQGSGTLLNKADKSLFGREGLYELCCDILLRKLSRFCGLERFAMASDDASTTLLDRFLFGEKRFLFYPALLQVDD
jgi:hypothetical protein